MVKRAHYLLWTFLIASAFWILPSCTEVLGIDTDYGENPCNADKLPDPIDCGEGACHVFVEACGPDGLPVECAPGQKQDADTCGDAIDNDCDGSVDENDSGDCTCGKSGTPTVKECYSGSPSTRGKGACHDGTQACTNSTWGACSGDVLPSKELPDGFDNDCDGEIDEGLECQQGSQQYCYDGPPGTLNVKGAPCTKGTQTCKDGKWSKCVGEVVPSIEVCDLNDNDCNGMVDDTGICECTEDKDCYTGTPETTDGVGPCKGGKQKCIDGKLGDKCEGEITPQAEICEGMVDDDCNGSVDNTDSPDPPCACKTGTTEPCYTGMPKETENLGPCHGGTRTCVNGTFGKCEDEVTPITEVCNGLDDNCDGSPDNGVPGVGDVCFIDGYVNTPCHQGKQTCLLGSTVPKCVPNVQPGMIAESCNIKDDDCNGAVDDGQFCCPNDGVKSGNETDLDCGGSCATKCADGLRCAVDVDCKSNKCNDTFCLSPDCLDGVKNGTETDVDCGGTCAVSNKKCPQGNGCLLNNDCISNVCDANSKTCAQKPDGFPCALPNECLSGNCVDAVCCNTLCNSTCQACTAAKKGGGQDGVCSIIAVGTDPDEECGTQAPASCGTNGACDGAGACQKYLNGTQCTMSSCADATNRNKPDTCNGAGSCVDAGTESCNAYTCDSNSGLCRVSCANDGECAMNAYCNAPSCAFKKPNGTPCGAAKECSSGSCADGVCCDLACSGVCQACTAAKKGPGGGLDGACGPNAANTDPDNDCAVDAPSTCGLTGNCNGAAACEKYSNVTECAPAACANVTTLNKADSCNGNGTCINAGTQDCTPFVCAGNACKTMCSSDLECATSYYCNGLNCLQKKVNGTLCGLNNECVSGNCIDGVCCNTACGSLCQSCLASEKVAGADGVCGAVKVGNDPDNDCSAQLATTCGTTGACNGSGACQLFSSGTQCVAATCSGPSTLSIQDQCNGSGACIDGGTQSCVQYACANGACKISCMADGDCATGYFCSSQACVAKEPLNSPCLLASECQSGFCADGVCCNAACSGACKACDLPGTGGACVDVPSGQADAPLCTAGNVCNGSGSCQKGPGQPCANGLECLSAFCADGVCCNSACGGTCQTCSLAGNVGSCVNVPAGQPDNSPACNVGASCNGSGVCQKVDGSVCAAAGECQSGNCADGVCCNSACGGPCLACTAAKTGGANGACLPIPSNSDPDAECADQGVATCGLNGSCDGAGACAKYAANSQCLAASCMTTTAVNARTCDGNGTCNGNGTVDCGNFLCQGGACPNTCANDSQCASTAYCMMSSCVPKKTGPAPCSMGNECVTGNCADSLCCNVACGGFCQACTAAKTGGTNGICANVTVNTDPDGECAGVANCNGSGACQLQVDGSACTLAAECLSGNCVDGVCCNTGCTGTCLACNVPSSVGTCSSVPQGQDDAPTCIGTTTCDGGGLCKKKNGQACAAGQCASGNCVDGVCCDDACGGLCQACTLAKTGQPSGTCSSVSSSTDPDGECAGTTSCNGSGACALLANGAVCTLATECTSNSCVDGVCCDGGCTGLCQACTLAKTGQPSGTCSNVLSGQTDPGTCTGTTVCNGGGACLKTTGQVCGGAGECLSGNCVDGVCCGSACDSACQACSNAKTGAANGTCTNVTANTDPENECSGSTNCSAGACTKLANGVMCGNAGECTSNNCVDGVCCNNACGSLCQACTMAKTGSANGTCANVTTNTDPENECIGALSCTGGACSSPLANGAACSDAGECASSNCVDGVCCGSACDSLCQACSMAKTGQANGTCANVTANTDPESECATECDGTGVCEAANGTACSGAAQCQSGSCTDDVCCDSACGSLCQSCILLKTGQADGTCSDITGNTDPDGECAGSRTCTGGACSTPLVDGTACTVPGECASGNCVDGVCCNSACGSTCQSCSMADTGQASGTCANVIANTDPAGECAGAECNGSGACEAANGTGCSSAAQCQSGNCVDGFCCNSTCTGTCQACSAAKKGSGSNGTCGNIANNNDPDSECLGASCNGSGLCKAQDNGGECTVSGECSSGNCIDGFCCNTSCGLACNACNIPGSEGTCSSVPLGQDDNSPVCAGTSSCNGAGACKVENGGACFLSAACFSNICVTTCLGKFDDACAMNSDCASDICTGATMTCEKGVTGKPCGANPDCASNMCMSSVCL